MGAVGRSGGGWDVELNLAPFDARLETSLGPVEVDLVEIWGRRWLRVMSSAFEVRSSRYSLSAKLERDENAALVFTNFEVSARSGRKMPRSRFSDAELQLLEIARERALENTSL